MVSGRREETGQVGEGAGEWPGRQRKDGSVRGEKDSRRWDESRKERGETKEGRLEGEPLALFQSASGRQTCTFLFQASGKVVWRKQPRPSNHDPVSVLQPIPQVHMLVRLRVASLPSSFTDTP